MSVPVGITPPPASKRFLRWQRHILGVCLVIFAFELGLVLLVFPWSGNWDVNWLPLHSRLLSNVWLNPYFRGALSGLGVVNIYVAFSEAARQIAALFPRKAG